MGFYDRDKALRGMGQARENMSNIIAQSANASAQANDNIAKAIGTISDGITKSVAGYLKNEADLKKDLERKNALVSALEKGGASKEIVEAARSAKKSDDVLPLVGIFTNPKNIVEIDHSYGKVRTKDLLRNKEEDIGTSYVGMYGSGSGSKGNVSNNKTHFTSSLQALFNSNPELLNRALASGNAYIDENRTAYTYNYGASMDFVAQELARQNNERIEAEEAAWAKKRDAANASAKIMMENDKKAIEASKKKWGY